ncbi:Cys-tRNA(Pro) deacylase [Ureibacillus acetophenoni]|uniref:Cys-tRNA(Pro)/Cys-tRNA(Cys) deacylase n=1 Tax=Ureibacillus acetophenoni TaxID=614649 RepID=A0A285UH84_9BACL|nr:Cys-tRNA(Pro) deacylase [Ureibacillus acetophenoni]SOC39611.1 Cys-tRNA(Pro)/Cys-tRNA(Cys) deacylase [Ureibacillus acetophenoni]
MTKQKTSKTNAVRLLDQQKIAYKLFEYEVDEHIDGVSVATKIGHSVSHVYKTLVTTAGTGKFFVFVIPVSNELDLKKCAKVAGEKKVEMIHVNDLLNLTGYVRGGCSPIGMKKLFPTFVYEGARELDYLIVSAGKRGMQIKLAPIDLLHVTKGSFSDIVKDT